MLTTFRNDRVPARRRRRALGIAPLAAVAVVVGLFSACVGTDQSNALTILRNDRAQNRVRTIVLDRSARDEAQQHAEAMARQGSLYHSALDLAPGECAKGENVGYGGSITQVERMFMNSPPHRRNILNGRYDHVGLGVVRSGGRVWVVQLFSDVC